jgi:hypothetical protein
MKKRLLTLLPILCFFAPMALGQTTTTNNVRPATTAFLGWDGTGTNFGSLDIKNLFASQPINFYSGTTPTLRCSITSTGDFDLTGQPMLIRLTDFQYYTIIVFHPIFFVEMLPEILRVRG